MPERSFNADPPLNGNRSLTRQDAENDRASTSTDTGLRESARVRMVWC